MLSMAGSGLEAGAGTSKDGDAAVSCEQCVPTWAWGQYWLWHHSARNGGVIRAAQITVTEHPQIRPVHLS